ncbi:MAG: hypothetical protein LBD70_03635, partial [Bifidobacteriaceae bacterium]|nr:hypothetical protein [Bifidobacteriaceae bacterium]
MLRFTLRQLRMSLRQAVGGAMSIVVATAFIAAAMAGSTVMDRTIENIMAEPYAGADLVVGRADFYDIQYLPPTAADDAAAIDGVRRAFQSVMVVAAQVDAGDRSELTEFRATSTDTGLATWPVGQGRQPQGADEASLAKSLAERLGIGLGDQIAVTVLVYPAWDEGYAAGDEGAAEPAA